jgi:hypothetical protein
MNVLIIYFMGSLLGLGISYTFVNSKYWVPDSYGSKKKTLFYGFISSWLSVLAFIIGIFIGLFGIGRE